MHERTLGRQFWRIAAGVFGLVALINYLPIVSGQIPFPRDEVLRHSAWNGEPQEQLPELIDIVAMFYPFRALIAEGADEPTLPLWNPHIMSGAPFQANAQSAVLAPLNILYYVLPLKIAWTAVLVVRLFLAAIFMALFVRSIGGSATGSILSGILFSLCGFTIQWQGMSNGDSAIWLPLICYSVHRLHMALDSRSVAIAAFAFAMPVLSGHPETAAHSIFVACAMALLLWSLPEERVARRRVRTRFAVSFVLAGCLAVGLASVQMIPTFEWMDRLGLQVEAPQPVLDRHQGQGFFSRDITRNPSSAGIWIPEGSAYVGMLGLLGAFLAPFHPSRRYVYFLAGVAIVAAAVAFGIQPVRWMIVHLPIIKAMKNGRLTLVVDFALAALAGLGISAIGAHRAMQGDRMRRRAITIVGAAVVVLCFCIYEVHRATLSPVELSRSPLASLIFLAAAFLALALRLRGGLIGRSFSVLICGLAGLEMLTFSYGYLGFAPMHEVFPPAPVFDFLRTRDHSAPFRVAKDRVPIPHNAGMIYGFDSADGYDLTTERARLFTADLIEQREDGIMFLAEKILAARDRRLDMLNVKYLMVSTPGPQFDMLSASDRFLPVFSQRGVAVFENRRSLPRFFSAPLSRIEVIRDRSAQLLRLKEASFDPQQTVIFSESPRELNAANSEPVALNVGLQVVDNRINGYRIRMESTAPAVLVVSQMYYPGWKAMVDGSEVPVYAVNVALTGLVIAKGSHDIRLFFQPESFRLGLMISLASLVVACLLFIGSTPMSARNAIKVPH